MTSCAVFLVIFCSAFIPMILKIKKITNWCYRNCLLFHSTWVHLGLWWDPCYYHVVYCHYFTSVVCKLFTFYSSSIETNGLIRSRLSRDDHWMVLYNVFFLFNEIYYRNNISQDTKKIAFCFCMWSIFVQFWWFFFSFLNASYEIFFICIPTNYVRI